MAEYIERTEELMLAMNAGARAIENTKRYHGAVYNKDVFSESPQEIPYLLAAKVLREVSDTPAADVAPVVYCRECKRSGLTEFGKRYCSEPMGAFEGCIPVEDDSFCSGGKRREDAHAQD